MAISKYKATAFKKYTVRHQLSYLHKCLHKPSSITIHSYSTRSEEINGLLKHSPMPKNKPLSEGYLIYILVNMEPAQWCKSMVQINFEHKQKNLTEVVEYFKYLKGLDTTGKKSDTKKKVMIIQKSRLSPNDVLEVQSIDDNKECWNMQNNIQKLSLQMMIIE